MRTRCARIIIACALLAVPPASSASAVEVGSKRLIEHAKAFDGKVITYTGEVVAAILPRGSHSWLTVHDGDNAIGVWCRADQAAAIQFVGTYKARGDTVSVIGVFNRACEEHGGDLDIHADAVSVVKAGHPVSETVNRKKTRLAFVLFFFTIALVLVFRKRL